MRSDTPAAKPEAAAGPTAKQDAVDQPGGAMTDELRAIDTAPLERLLDIRKEETRLEDYRRKAEDMKGKVKEPVWRRVVDDYTGRVATLERQASPLRDQVRAEYQKLRVLLDRSNASRESADLEKAEFEFRHAVGELTDRQLEERLRGPAKTLEQCAADLAAIEELRSRFLSAFGSEQELHAPAAPAAAPAAPELADTPVATPAEFAAPAAASESPAAPGEAAESAEESDATGAMPVEKLASIVQASSSEPEPKQSEVDNSDERTFMLPLAGLVITDGTLPAREYRLATMNYLGRSEECQIVITKPGVSRKHAMIIASADGFTIRDLGSQNGTFVNGKRIADHTLKNGDQIVIADTKLTFRSPWPAASGAKH